MECASTPNSTLSKKRHWLRYFCVQSQKFIFRRKSTSNVIRVYLVVDSINCQKYIDFTNSFEIIKVFNISFLSYETVPVPVNRSVTFHFRGIGPLEIYHDTLLLLASYFMILAHIISTNTSIQKSINRQFKFILT